MKFTFEFIKAYHIGAYPNPAKDQLHVYHSTDSIGQNNSTQNDNNSSKAGFVNSPISARLYDLNGKQILTGFDANGEIIFDVKGIPSGLYIIKSEIPGTDITMPRKVFIGNIQ